jgi:hypothetical protein
MTEKPDETVSLSKSQDAEPSDSPSLARPRTVLLAAVALVVGGLASLIAALDLYGLGDWLRREQIKSDKKAKPPKHHTAAQLDHLVSQQQSGALIGSIIVMLAVLFLAYGVFRGRHWSRWAVIAFWFLASFTGTLVGIGAVLNVGSSAPAAFRLPAFVAGAAMIVAVAYVNLRPSTEYFAAHRPVAAPGAPVRRGLFAPRVPTRSVSASAALKSNAATRGEAYVQRQRAKKRAADNRESVARGAELARQRAKASKSRRVEQ